jgi:hypothetical protein
MPSQENLNNGKKEEPTKSGEADAEPIEESAIARDANSPKAAPLNTRRPRKGLARSIRKWMKARPFFQRLTATVGRDYEARAEEDYQFSRPPEGVELQFRFIRLIELFHIEDLERLQKAVLNLFPGIEQDLNVKDRVRSFLEDAGDVFSHDTSWKFGFIARSRLFVHTPFREMANLPEEVKHIDVEVYKFTPSSFALCLDVYMSDQATQKLNELHSKKYYKDETPFMARLKWALFKKGLEYRISNRRQEILKYLTTLRSNIERSLPKYLKGYFLRKINSNGVALLPAIEVFTIKGEPINEEEFAQWAVDTRGWSDSFGFDFYFSPFKSHIMFFNWASNTSWQPGTAHRLIFLHDTYLSSRHESLQKEFHIKFEFDNHITELTPLIAIHHYLQTVRKRVSKLKVSALREMQIKWWSWFWPRMRRLIKLSNIIQQESMLMDRLSIEWGAKAKEISESKHVTRNMGTLMSLKTVGDSSKEEKDNLRDALFRLINQQLEDLGKQLTHLRTWYADHLVSRNTWVTYGLTIVVGIATIVGLISIRDDLLSLWQYLLSLIKK